MSKEYDADMKKVEYYQRKVDGAPPLSYQSDMLWSKIEAIGNKWKNIEKISKKLYKSPDFFIKYSAGKPIACYPYEAGSSFYSMGKEKVCNSTHEAHRILREVSESHAVEIYKAQQWEQADAG